MHISWIIKQNHKGYFKKIVLIKHWLNRWIKKNRKLIEIDKAKQFMSKQTVGIRFNNLVKYI